MCVSVFCFTTFNMQGNTINGFVFEIVGADVRAEVCLLLFNLVIYKLVVMLVQFMDKVLVLESVLLRLTT